MSKRKVNKKVNKKASHFELGFLSPVHSKDPFEAEENTSSDEQINVSDDEYPEMACIDFFRTHPRFLNTRVRIIEDNSVFSEDFNTGLDRDIHIDTIIKFAVPNNNPNKHNTLNFALSVRDGSGKPKYGSEYISLLLDNGAKPSNLLEFNTAKILYYYCKKYNTNDYRNRQEKIIEYCLLNTIKLLLPYDSLEYLFYLRASILKLIFASNIYGSISKRYISSLMNLMDTYKNESDINGFMIDGDTDKPKRYLTVNRYVRLLNKKYVDPAKADELRQFAIELDTICDQYPDSFLQKLEAHTTLIEDLGTIVDQYATRLPQKGFWQKEWRKKYPALVVSKPDSAAAIPESYLAATIPESDLAAAIPEPNSEAATAVSDLTPESNSAAAIAEPESAAEAIPNLAASTVAVTNLTTRPRSYAAAAQSKAGKKYIKYKMKYIALKKKIMNI
jgi:hypothetical protein